MTYNNLGLEKPRSFPAAESARHGRARAGDDTTASASDCWVVGYTRVSLRVFIKNYTDDYNGSCRNPNAFDRQVKQLKIKDN